MNDPRHLKAEASASAFVYFDNNAAVGYDDPGDSKKGAV